MSNNIDITNEDIAAQIYEKVSEIKSLEKPTIIEAEMDNKTIELTYNKINELSFSKKISLISKLGKNHRDLGNSHNFTELSHRAIKNSKNRLKEKIAYLELQRKSNLIVELEEQLEKQNK